MKTVKPLLICLILLVIGVVLLLCAISASRGASRSAVEQNTRISGPAAERSRREPVHQDETLNKPEQNDGLDKTMVASSPTTGISRQHALKIVGAGSLADRLQRLQLLGADLQQTELHALYSIIDQGKPVGLTDDQYHVLVNEVLDKLVSQAAEPADLPSRLGRWHSDVTKSVVVRDYVLQHIGVLYERSAAQGQLLDILKSALHERDSSLAATALVTLHGLTQQGMGVTMTEVCSEALNMLEDRAAGDACRVSALSICGMEGVEGAIDLAANWVGSDQSIAVRIAAVRTLGQSASVENKELLAQLASSTQYLVAASARAVLSTTTD